MFMRGTDRIAVAIGWLGTIVALLLVVVSVLVPDFGIYTPDGIIAGAVALGIWLDGFASRIIGKLQQQVEKEAGQR